MKKFTNLLVSLIALISVTTAARADLIALPEETPSSDHSWIVVLVIVVVIVAVAILHSLRKK